MSEFLDDTMRVILSRMSLRFRADLRRACIPDKEDLQLGIIRSVNRMHKHKTATNRVESQNYKTADNLSACPLVRVNLAYVEDGCQATPFRKLPHHNFMHDLGNRSVNRYVVVRSSLTSSTMSPRVFGCGSLPG